MQRSRSATVTTDAAGEPELSFLLRACYLLVTRAEADLDGLDAPHPVAWPRLWSQSTKLRVNPLLNRLLMWRGDLEAPPWLLEAANISRVYYDLRTAWLVGEARQIGKAFSEAGIVFTARKGVILQQHYPEPACRPFTDLDFFVDRQQVEQATTVLEDLGYRSLDYDRAQLAYLRIATNYQPTMQRPGGLGEDGVYLDVATLLTLPSQGIRPVSGLLGRRIVGDGELPRPAPADMLIDVCINLFIATTTLYYVYKLRFQRLVPYLDVVILTRLMDEDDWKVFDAIVMELDLERTVAYVFAHCCDLFPDVPEADRWRPRIEAAQLEPGFTSTVAWDDESPYTWRESLRSRLVLDRLPDDVPPQNSPLP